MAAPNTKSITNHGMSLSATSGGVQALGGSRIVGAVNGWNPGQSLGVSEVFGFGQSPGNPGQLYGVPYEKVPGNVGGMTISVNRYDLYTDLMEEAFGTATLDMLSKQINAFVAAENWQVPDANGGVQETYKKEYQGVWFSNIGRSYSATGDRLSNVSGTLEYTYTRLIRS